MWRYDMMLDSSLDVAYSIEGRIAMCKWISGVAWWRLNHNERFNKRKGEGGGRFLLDRFKVRLSVHRSVFVYYVQYCTFAPTRSM